MGLGGDMVDRITELFEAILKIDPSAALTKGAYWTVWLYCDEMGPNELSFGLSIEEALENALKELLLTPPEEYWAAKDEEYRDAELEG